MPRLHGYRERIWMNIYDAVFYGSELPIPPTLRLFGDVDVNINGAPSSPHPHNADATLMITNWYARTNLLEPAERTRLDAVANEMTATLIIGDRPYYTVSVYDLLRRAPDQKFEHGAKYEDVAQDLADQKAKKIVSISKATDVRPEAVAAVLEHAKLAQPTVTVPMQKSYGIRVETTNLAAVDEMRRAFDRPTLRPALWIHLEGWQVRDITNAY